MDVERIAEGLWIWTAPHPEWKPEEEWAQDVGCVYVEDPEAVVLIDPLVPADEEERFWRALDRDVERLGLPVRVVTTSAWHERSAAAIEARYGATREPPAGVETLRVSPEEVVVWLPAYRTLFTGDALLGGPSDLRLQPPSWVDGPYDEFVDAVARLRDLPVEVILPSHGEPVVERASETLARAVAHAQSAQPTDG